MTNGKRKRVGVFTYGNKLNLGGGILGRRRESRGEGEREWIEEERSPSHTLALCR